MKSGDRGRGYDIVIPFYRGYTVKSAGDTVKEFEERGFVFYIMYPGGKLAPFVDNGTNGHQKMAADQFIRSGQVKSKISVPHAVSGIFTAEFAVTHAYSSESCSNWYTYTPEGRPPVHFQYSEPGHPEYVASRMSYWMGE
jgi:hypothetical protein